MSLPFRDTKHETDALHAGTAHYWKTLVNSRSGENELDATHRDMVAAVYLVNRHSALRTPMDLSGLSFYPLLEHPILFNWITQQSVFFASTFLVTLFVTSCAAHDQTHWTL